LILWFKTQTSGAHPKIFDFPKLRNKMKQEDALVQTTVINNPKPDEF